jgi:hypothetical protein
MIPDSQPEPANDQTRMENSTLADLETVIARGLPRQDEVALALLEIHERKLYRPAYKSFKDYLLRRWELSRARGYQMLHFARLKRMSTTVDRNNPNNERQARTLDAHGNARLPREEDPVLRAMNYLANVFFRLPANRRHEFIEAIRDLLAEMEQAVNRRGQPKAQA